MKGIVMAGGTGSRMFPITLGTNKHLIPIYDKPMIYYPLSILMTAGIKDITIVCRYEDKINYLKLLGNGENLGIKISYTIQSKPNGIAEAFVLAEKFISQDNVCLILGDNILYTKKIKKILQDCIKIKKGAYVFAYKVTDPSRYGVIELDNNRVINIVEKPKNPKTNFAVPGIYFYDNSVLNIAKQVKYSERGELEITSINSEYLKRKELKVKQIDSNDSFWFDAGTVESLFEASQCIKNIEEKNKQKIACLEEIAINMHYKSKEQMMDVVSKYPESDYKRYLLSVFK